MGACAGSGKQGSVRGSPNKNKATKRIEFSERLDSVYSKYNKDGSGYLSRQEVAQLIKDSIAGDDDNLTEQEINEFIDALSRQNGGKINKQDMLALFCRLSQGH